MPPPVNLYLLTFFLGVALGGFLLLEFLPLYPPLIVRRLGAVSAPLSHESLMSPCVPKPKEGFGHHLSPSPSQDPSGVFNAPMLEEIVRSGRSFRTFSNSSYY